MAEPKIPRQKKESPMLESALRYLKRGWNVIPLDDKKEPRLDSWKQYQQLRVAEKEVRWWWTKWPNANIAVLTGGISNLVVIDVDEEQGWEHLKPYLGRMTLTCETGKGTHLYFRHPGDFIPNAVRFLPGVDCRGDGGYVVAPPSYHLKAKRKYRWEDVDVKLAMLPQGLLELILKKGQKKLTPEDWEKDLPDGERDTELTRRIGKLVRDGHSPAAILAMAGGLNTAFCKPPLKDAQVKKIVVSIAGRGTVKPQRKVFSTTSNRDMFLKYGESEPRWAIDKWLPEASCGLIVAPPGSYKTWLLCALAFSTGTGRPFLGQYRVINKGPILTIQQEDPFPMLMSKLAKMFNSKEPIDDGTTYELDCRFVEEMLSMPIHWHEDRELNLEDKACMIRIEEKIVELKPTLVTIDPLYSTISAKEYMAIGAQAMLYLKKLRDRYGCSFAIAHHTTVAGSTSEDRSTIWGSQFLNAWLEFGWQVRETGDKDGGVKIVRHFKGSGAPKKLRLVFKITDYSFEAEITDIPASVSDMIEEAILNGRRPESAKDVQEITGCSKAQSFRILKKMKLEDEEEPFQGGE